MKAASFRFLRAKSVADAVALKADYGEDARFIAGGQSLVPALNLRLLEPRALIDIAGLRDLSGVLLADERLVIGALTRHAQLANDPLIAAHAPLLLRALPCLALDAEMIFTGPQITGERRIAAADFFRGLYATALGPDDLLLRVELPIQKPEARSVALELARRHGDFAIVGIVGTCLDGKLGGLRLSFFGVADRPLRFPTVEKLLMAGEMAPAIAELKQKLDPPSDPCHSSATKKYLAGVLLQRAINQLRSHG